MERYDPDRIKTDTEIKDLLEKYKGVYTQEDLDVYASRVIERRVCYNLGNSLSAIQYRLEFLSEYLGNIPVALDEDTSSIQHVQCGKDVRAFGCAMCR